MPSSAAYNPKRQGISGDGEPLSLLPDKFEELPLPELQPTKQNKPHNANDNAAVFFFLISFSSYAEIFITVKRLRVFRRIFYCLL